MARFFFRTGAVGGGGGEKKVPVKTIYPGDEARYEEGSALDQVGWRQNKVTN